MTATDINERESWTNFLLIASHLRNTCRWKGKGVPQYELNLLCNSMSFFRRWHPFFHGSHAYGELMKTQIFGVNPQFRCSSLLPAAVLMKMMIQKSMKFCLTAIFISSKLAFLVTHQPQVCLQIRKTVNLIVRKSHSDSHFGSYFCAHSFFVADASMLLMLLDCDTKMCRERP